MRYFKVSGGWAALAIVAVIASSLTVCEAQCASATLAAAHAGTHDCCAAAHNDGATHNHARCNLCVIVSAVGMDATAHGEGLAAIAPHHCASATMNLLSKALRIDNGGFYLPQKTTAQSLHNESSIAKNYQHLISHLYYEVS